MSDVEQISYGEIMPRVGELASELLQHPDREVREKVEELLDWVDVFHREGLGRLVEMVRLWRGEIFLESVAEDEVTATFLWTYDLGESRDRDLEAEERVNEALEELRPFVESHGGSIILDEIVDGVVKVQMLGSCDGCPSSAATLTGGVEEALRRHWPNFRRLEVVEPDAEGDSNGGVGAPQPAEPLIQIGKKPPTT